MKSAKAHFVVIFRAEVKNLDADYLETAKRMRELAFERYGCLDFSASLENGLEIAVSYWPSLEHIKRWKEDPEHKQAQALGKARWYESYRVEVASLC